MESANRKQEKLYAKIEKTHALYYCIDYTYNTKFRLVKHKRWFKLVLNQLPELVDQWRQTNSKRLFNKPLKKTLPEKLFNEMKADLKIQDNTITIFCNSAVLVIITPLN